MSKLLPSNHEQFRTKDYWDRFFQERGCEAFEWYGSYADMAHLVAQHAPNKQANILVIGCGNSEFSHHLYDAGYTNIRNVDYSEVVIDEMKKKNANNRRPGMHWDVGDMTDMSADYMNNQFSLVIDKGALDALMSVDSEDARSKANKMFCEINRITADEGGKYLCVSLVESFILRGLLQYFVQDVVVEGENTDTTSTSTSTSSWLTQIETFVPLKSGPFCPVFLGFTKLTSVASKPATTVTAAKSILCRIDATGVATTKPERLTAQIFYERILAVQDFAKAKAEYNLAVIRPGRFDTFELWSQEADKKSQLEGEGEAAVEEATSASTQAQTKIPKFTLLVLDVPEVEGRISAAVFFIPQGKEAHYQFCTEKGLADIATLAQCRRLIAVRCNRPHIFPKNLAELQGELNPMVVPLLPAGRDENEQVPYVAIPDDGGWDPVARGSSLLSGAYVVEEGEPYEDDSDEEETASASETKEKDSAVMRRLIFLNCPHFIQTEARLSLVPSIAETDDDAEAQNKHIQTLSNDWNMEIMEGYEFDSSYLDSHHRAVLAGLALSPYEWTSSSGNAMIVGLGGGAFPMALHKYCPHMSQAVCDIDPTMLEIAVSYFGYRPKVNHSKFDGCDGIEYIAKYKEDKLNIFNSFLIYKNTKIHT